MSEDELIQLEITDRECAAVTAALRFWQRCVTDKGVLPETFPEKKFVEGNHFSPLTSLEIDSLVDRIVDSY